MGCDYVEIVRGFAYHGDTVNVGGGCDAVVTASTRSGRVRYRECGELLYGMRCALRLTGAVSKSSIRSACFMEVKHGA